VAQRRPYDQPASLETTTAAGACPGEAEELEHTALARTDWLDDLLSGRYLPRIEPVEQLLAELDQAVT